MSLPIFLLISYKTPNKKAATCTSCADNGPIISLFII